MNEHDWLQAFLKERSEAAFAQLVRRYAGLVYSVARRRSANAALAEDITQMVFIRFAKSPPNVQTPAALAAWLHRTTVNVTIDTWRSETRRRNREQQALPMETTPSENTIWEELSPDLDDALNQLSDEDRQAVLLRFFGQKTMRDVGLALGVSEDAAKMRISRALDRLRNQLGPRALACTAAVLGSILAERSVEAAPLPLLTRLSAIKLPALTTAAGVAKNPFRIIPRASKFVVASGTVILALIGLIAFRSVPPSPAPTAETIAASEHANHPSNLPRIAQPARAVSADSAIPAKPIKILFHVLDSETGAGLPGTQIQVAYFGPGGQGEGHHLLTDRNGDAAIPQPYDPAKHFGPNIFVTAESHVPMGLNFHNAAVPSDYTLKLDPAMTAGGLIVDEQGFPVPDVKISIRTPGNKQGQTENVDFQTCPVTNHADGSWACSYIPKDYTNIPFILKKAGYATTFLGAPVHEVDLTNLILVLNRGYTVTGQITDPENRPVANARISVNGSDRELEQSVKSDEQGVYILTGVQANNTEGPQWIYERRPLETNGFGAVTIRSAHIFCGPIRYTLEKNDTLPYYVEQGILPPGESEPLQLALTVQAKHFASQNIVVSLLAPTNFTNITLSRGNIFRGHIVDETGMPISNAVVQTDFDFEHQLREQYEWNTHTDPEGRFEWDSAPTEEIHYWFAADGYQDIRSTPFPADNTDHLITLQRNPAK